MDACESRDALIDLQTDRIALGDRTTRVARGRGAEKLDAGGRARIFVRRRNG